MVVDDVKNFLMERPGVKFVSKEMAEEMGVTLDAVRGGLRKIMKVNAHHDSRFKNEKGNKIVRVTEAMGRKPEYDVSTRVTFVWFEE